LELLLETAIVPIGYSRMGFMTQDRRETATLAGGCFWCLEAVFDQLRGVEGVQSGYSGGQVENPSYELVCSGTTGHAEAVQVTFDASAISFADLLEVFFTIHDPTTLNRQGADVGTQYRSAVFYDSEEQRAITESVIADFNTRRVWDGEIVTQVAPLETFYPAEDYHDDYFRRNPAQPYCQAVIAPKVAKARKLYLDRLKK
jgi:peptide-methionine (S)-S-oxide reductase